MAENIGRVISISGPAVDVQFEEKTMPPIYQRAHRQRRLCCAQADVRDRRGAAHLGEGRVRCVAMAPTDGMVRGMKASTPARGSHSRGPRNAGRVMNVLGDPVDELGPITSEFHMPIHRPAPAFDEQSTSEEMFETGIKVID